MRDAHDALLYVLRRFLRCCCRRQRTAPAVFVAFVDMLMLMMIIRLPLLAFFADIFSLRPDHLPPGSAQVQGLDRPLIAWRPPPSAGA